MYKINSENLQKRRERIRLKNLNRPDGSQPSRDELAANVSIKIGAIDKTLKTTSPEEERERLNRQRRQLSARKNKLAPSKNGKGAVDHFIDAAREILPPHEYRSIVNSAIAAFEIASVGVDRIAQVRQFNELTETITTLTGQIPSLKGEERKRAGVLMNKLGLEKNVVKHTIPPSIDNHFVKCARSILTVPVFQIILSNASERATRSQAISNETRALRLKYGG
jgi:hypothetical protein